MRGVVRAGDACDVSGQRRGRGEVFLGCWVAKSFEGGGVFIMDGVYCVDLLYGWL